MVSKPRLLRDELSDGRQYQLKYNYFGELAQVDSRLAEELNTTSTPV
jgi:hypothetical protein